MLREILVKEGAQFDVNTAADKVTFTIADDVEIVEIGLIIAGADAGGATVKFDKRPTAGSDTSRGDGDIGEITIPAADSLGKVLYEKVSDTTVLRGEQIVVQVTAEGVTALNVVPYYKYVPIRTKRENQGSKVVAA